jgi:hypothetical protein
MPCSFCNVSERERLDPQKRPSNGRKASEIPIASRFGNSLVKSTDDMEVDNREGVSWCGDNMLLYNASLILLETIPGLEIPQSPTLHLAL